MPATTEPIHDGPRPDGRAGNRVDSQRGACDPRGGAVARAALLLAVLALGGCVGWCPGCPPHTDPQQATFPR